ncbi:hypothetical protein MK280_00570, partial [Myxococcota bacterium]|nr:hypothetical protein [Myxococcota bacterium]
MNRLIQRRIGVAWAIMLCGTALQGCTNRPPETSSACTPLFADAKGWQGGDAAYSIPLPGAPAHERRTLWLFGDSFIQPPDAQMSSDRSNSSFIHNSIAISRCLAAGFAIDYAWKHSTDGAPNAFFQPSDGDEFWWPLDGFIDQEKLFIAMLRVAPAPPSGPLHLPFRLLGTSLIEVDNPTQPPAQWNWRARPLSKGSEAMPGAAIQLWGQHVLLFSYRNDPTGGRSRFLSRLPVSALRNSTEDLEAQLQTLNHEGRWEEGFHPHR